MTWTSAQREERRKRIGYYHSEQYRKLQKKNGYYSYQKKKQKTYALKPQTILARNLVYRAVRDGRIKRPVKCQVSSCEVSTPLQAHHYLGYDKEHWLDVIWLCQEHHKQAHHG